MYSVSRRLCSFGASLGAHFVQLITTYAVCFPMVVIKWRSKKRITLSSFKEITILCYCILSHCHVTYYLGFECDVNNLTRHVSQDVCESSMHLSRRTFPFCYCNIYCPAAMVSLEFTDKSSSSEYENKSWVVLGCIWSPFTVRSRGILHWRLNRFWRSAISAHTQIPVLVVLQLLPWVVVAQW